MARMTWGSGQRKWFATLMTDIGKIALAGFGVAPFIQPGRSSFWIAGVGFVLASACFLVAFFNQEEG